MCVCKYVHVCVYVYVCLYSHSVSVCFSSPSLSLAHSCTLLHAVIWQDFSSIIPTTKPTNVALLLSYLSHLAFTKSGMPEMNNHATSAQKLLAQHFNTGHAMSGVMTSQQGNFAPFAQQVPAQDDNKVYTVQQQPQPMQMGQMGGGMGLPPPPFDAPPPVYGGGKVDTINAVAKPAF
jgi:hypothetical protein